MQVVRKDILNGIGEKTMFDLVITGGTVVTPNQSVELDVAVKGGEIVALARRGTIGRDAKRIVNADNLYVLPGAIDPHTHSFREWQGKPIPGFDVSTKAAAYGGTTTVIDFAEQKGEITASETV